MKQHIARVKVNKKRGSLQSPFFYVSSQRFKASFSWDSLPLHEHRHHCSVVGIPIFKGKGIFCQLQDRNIESWCNDLSAFLWWRSSRAGLHLPTQLNCLKNGELSQFLFVGGCKSRGLYLRLSTNNKILRDRCRSKRFSYYQTPSHRNILSLLKQKHALAVKFLPDNYL